MRGVVDSEDLQLNVSREMLQESKSLRKIGRKIVRKIIQMMMDLAEKGEKEGDPKYLEFWEKYKKYIKIGVMEDNVNRRKLAKLLRFHTTKSEEKLTSLDDYLERMLPGQVDFFYIAGDPNQANITESPFLIPYRKKGIEVIYLSDPMEELMIKELKEYDNKIFICITQVERKSLITESDYEKEKLKQWKKQYKTLTNFFKEALDDRVTGVEVSTRLAADSRTPCVLAHTEGSASANMERYSRQQARLDPRRTVYESKKVLEINPTNNLIKRMSVAVAQVEAEGIEGPDPDDDKEEAAERLRTSKQKLETIALLLYDTAIFESGYIIGDTNEYAERVFDVLTRMTGLPDAPVLENEDLVGELLREEAEAEFAEQEAKAQEEEKKKREERRKRKEAEKRKEEEDQERKESEGFKNPDGEKKEEKEAEEAKKGKEGKKKGTKGKKPKADEKAKDDL
jgi:heat shock protein beta